MHFVVVYYATGRFVCRVKLPCNLRQVILSSVSSCVVFSVTLGGKVTQVAKGSDRHCKPR